MEKLVKVSLVAAKLGFHPEALYRRIREGLLPVEAYERFGRSVRVREELVTQYMKTAGKPSVETSANG